MIDQDGNPVDLSQYGFDVTVNSSSSGSSADVQSSSSGQGTCQFKMRWLEAICDNGGIVEVDASIVDAARSLIQADVPASISCRGGIYRTEAFLLNADDVIIFTNQFYTIVDASIAGGAPSGPPTIPEIRLHLADSGPNENLLLNDYKFDDAEIASCIHRPVMYWNEALPPINQVYDTLTFPYRYHWLEAIVGNLMLIAAERFRANHLPYSAGGVQIDDQAKFNLYQAEGERRTGVYKQWVQSMKISLNRAQCFGEVGSSYGMGY